MVSFKILMLIGLMIVSITVMPNILAKFQGQHYFIAPQNVQCTKCHADVAQELNQSMSEQQIHTSLGTTLEDACRACHITAASNKNMQFHAAALVECLACHDGSWTAPVPAPNVLTGPRPINGTDAAHRPFIEAMNTSFTTLSGPNEACIACHTHAGKAVLTEYSNYTVHANFSCTDPADINTCSWTFSISVQ